MMLIIEAINYVCFIIKYIINLFVYCYNNSTKEHIIIATITLATLYQPTMWIIDKIIYLYLHIENIVYMKYKSLLTIYICKSICEINKITNCICCVVEKYA